MIIARLALLLALILPAMALTVGDPMPPLISRDVMQRGPRLPQPFILDQYRGAALLLTAWSANGNAASYKRKLHENLVKNANDYGPKGIVVLGIADSRENVAKGAAQAGIGSPILIVDEESLASLGPFEPLHARRLLVGCDGQVVVAQSDNVYKDHEIAAAVSGLTFHGRWMSSRPPYFLNPTPVRQVQVLRELVNAGAIGKAMAKAAKLTTDDDQAVANEATYLLTTCQTWIDAVRLIEDEARAAGDIYTAFIIADSLADSLDGIDASDAAEERAKADKQADGYKLGKAFYDTWRKTWGKPRSVADKAFAAFVRKYDDETGYPIELAKRWSAAADP